jgi:NAD(P)H-dependent FMN reductase
MKLTVFNGSPRGLKSNTRILLSHFQHGFEETPGNQMRIFDLVHVTDQPSFRQAYEEAEIVLLAFPLYVDAMPGIVKTFIEESLAPQRERGSNPPIGFIVQSGFPEALHSRYVARYLEKLARRLNAPYLGTVIKGGVEGIQSQPEKMTRKLLDAFYRLGRSFGQNGQFDEAILHELAQPERFPTALRPLLWLFSKLGFSNLWWDLQLKQNEAYTHRFAQPYLDSDKSS